MTAFLRLEEIDTGKGFNNPAFKTRGLMDGSGEEELERLTSAKSARSGAGVDSAGNSIKDKDSISSAEGSSMTRKSSGRRIKAFVKGLTGSRDKDVPSPEEPQMEIISGGDNEYPNGMTIADGRTPVELIDPQSEKGVRRVLYTANVGDARAVLW